jgi:hypothetical protein
MSGFMKPVIEYAEYWEVETSVGTEIVPSDVVDVTNVGVLHDEGSVLARVAPYVEGTPRTVIGHHGWIARMSAPGYMDCTEWSCHTSYEAAAEYLEEMYGEESDE